MRAASRAGREDDLAHLFAALRSRFASTSAARAVSLHDPARHVRPGRELPAFDLPALEDVARSPRGARVTRASLEGSVAIVDLWGTWCVPCRAEMKFLERAFARHKDQGLRIVSIAVRDTEASVRNFRRSVSPMPWTHVLVGAREQEATLDLFESKSFPAPILVDRRGRILAMGDELRGEALLERAVLAALHDGGP